MSRVTLLLVRHGETEANRARLIQGRNDTPLTPEAVAGAARVAEKLRNLGVAPGDALFCSPLPRARHTLEHLRTHLPLPPEVTYDPRLLEIDFGDYTGRPVDEVIRTILRHKKHPHLPYPGGESGNDLKRRVLNFMERITHQHAGGRVLAVTHFGVIETALRHVRNLPLEEPVRPAHDSVFCLELGEGTPSAREV
ncbi:MAG: histidine phosphatase family protein [Nitrospirota bacterium]|nr:histidine phosphatase family protein [Nitrospirota bacterium]